jgi:formylglycine-generating enzyme required for sulfatase activity
MPASVSAIVPNVGGTAGGTQLKISGDYLALTTGVTIGGTACTSLTIVSPTTLTAIVPAGTLGNADVVITGGKGTIIVPGGYRYVSIVVPSWATLVEAQPDPTVVSDPFLFQAIAATGLAWRIRDAASGMPMVLVPPGTFLMGAAESDPQAGADERPQHSVTISRAFYLGQHEVTQAQWVAKLGKNPSYFQGGNYPEWENRPVEQVSWNAIQGFLAVTDCRLPTEAEWEYACRAGTVGVRYADPIDGIAWSFGNSGARSRFVGLLSPNQFGLYDMLGNVHECVADSRMTYTSTSQVDPFEPGDFRIHRGGSWLDYSSSVALRASWRSDRYSDTDKWAHVGFRVARNP